MSEWREVSLGDVCELKRGYDLPQSARRIGTVRVISSSGPTGWHDEAKVEGPGVVTGRYGTLGQVFFIAQDFWPLNTSLYVRDFKGNDPRFVAALLQSMDLARYDGAAAVPGLNRNQLHTLPVRVPCCATQRKVAWVLAVIDNLIANNARRAELLESAVRETYREWFVRFRFPGHEASALQSSPIGYIPEGWQVEPASRVLTVNPQISVDRSTAHPFTAMADVDEQTMACEPSQLRTGGNGSKFENGDTLFARITPCLENGKTGLVQFLDRDEVGLGSTEFIVLRGHKVGSAYTYCLARSAEFRRHAIASMTGASGRQRVRNECFDTFLLPVPPTATADSFEATAQPLLDMCQLLRQQSSQLATSRGLLLPKLVNGQVDISALDADDLMEGSTT